MKKKAKRLIQRVVELTLNPFVTKYASRNCVDSDVSWFEGGGLTVNSLTGAIKTNFKLAIHARAEFFIHWFHVLWVHLAAFFLKRGEQGKASLLFGVGKENYLTQKRSSQFHDYCFMGPIGPLVSANRLIVQAVGMDKSPGNRITYARFPLFALVRNNGSSFVQFAQFFKAHLKALFSYIYCSTRFPVTAILGRDFAYHGMVVQLNRRGLLDSVVLTNSNYTSQPLWMADLPDKKYSVHMVWYSMNIIPLLYRVDEIKSPVPNYRHIRVDEHWVWSEYYARYLAELGLTSGMNVVPPVMWYLPEKVHNYSSQNEIKIVLFDVTPISTETETRLGLVNIYYSLDTMSRFLHDILSAAVLLEGRLCRPIRILLKSKRAYNKGHDKRYADLLSKLDDENSIELVPHQENIYSLLSSCDLSITIPNSSPPLIAAYMNKNAIYYDPTGNLLPNHEPGARIFFVSGSEDLADQICSCVVA